MSESRFPVNTNAPMIYSALTHAAASINAVGKNGVNTQQGWKFRSIDAIYNALNPALVAAGLTIVPNVANAEYTHVDIKANNGNVRVLTTARLTMRYTVYAQDGSFIESTTIGEGADYGDKACNKAMAIAYKYMAFQLFCIPTEQMRIQDADLYVPAEEQPIEKTEQKSKHKATDEVKIEPNKTYKVSEMIGADKVKKVQVGFSRGEKLDELARLMKTDVNGVSSAWRALQSAGDIPNRPTATLTDEEFLAAVETVKKAFS